MNKAKFIIAGWAIALFIGCSSPQNRSAPPTLAPTVAVGAADPFTPQSDGGTDVIADNPTPTPVELAESKSTATELEPTATAIILNTIAPLPTSTPEATPLSPSDTIPTIGAISFVDWTGASGTEFIAPNEVFIQFEYANVPDGAAFKRDWYFNDALFISREEGWNGEALGSNGNRGDISIFDFEDGLAPGRYRVELSLDGVLQQTAEFSIVASQIENPDPVQGQKFSNLSFKGIGPYSMEVGETMETPTELFAIWFYEDMSADDTVRRDWYYNDELFITREEAWDFGEYSSSGIVDDISIFDYETGLLPGDYRLELFVNDQFQVEQSVTIIHAYELAALAEPVSGRTVSSDNINTVTVTNPDGTIVQKAVAGRIHSTDWFPGGERLIFAATTLTDSTAPIPAFAHASELWLWDIASDQLIQLGASENRYHSPRVSPDGRRVAVLSGSGYGDAGVVDSVVVVFQFDESGDLLGTTAVTDLTVADFDLSESFPWTVNKDDTYRKNLVSNNFDWIVSPGIWVDDSTLRTNLGFPSVLFDQHGVYDLNFDDLTARKIE